MNKSLLKSLRDKSIMFIDQGISSLISFIIPAVILKSFGEEVLGNFVIIQSYGIYFSSLYLSLFIGPYLYIEKLRNIGKSSNELVLTISNLLISFFSILILIFFWDDLIVSFYLVFAYQTVKETIRTACIHRNKFFSSISIQLFAIFIGIISLFLSKNFINYSLLTFFILAFLQSIRKFRFGRCKEYLTESIKIGKWSVINIILQLLITQVILSSLKEYQESKIIVSYGIIITLTGIANPLLSFLNNWSVQTFRFKKEKQALNLNDLIIRYRISFFILGSTFGCLAILFNTIVGFFYGIEYKFLIWLFISLSLTSIILSFNQLNSRLLTIFGERRVVFESGLLSLISVLILRLFRFDNWQVLLIVYFFLNKSIAWGWSFYRARIQLA